MSVSPVHAVLVEAGRGGMRSSVPKLHMFVNHQGGAGKKTQDPCKSNKRSCLLSHLSSPVFPSVVVNNAYMTESKITPRQTSGHFCEGVTRFG